MDESSIEASNAVKKLLFEPKNMDTKDIEFIFYKDEERYVKSFDDIMSSLHRSLLGKSAKVDIYIVNSTGQNTMNNIIKNMHRFTEGMESFKIEHLVGLSKKHPVKSIRILENFIPMLEFSSYSIFYTDSLPDSNSTMFSDYMMITYSYIEDGEAKFGYHSMSFLEDLISTCYVGYSKDCIYDMFTRNYLHIKEVYTPAISNSDTANFQELMNNIEFEDGSREENEIYLFKRTPCYKRIPSEVFVNMKKRLIEQGNIADFVKSVNTSTFVGEQEAVYMLDMIAKEMSQRYESSKCVRTVDILSKSGLENFVKTGQLSDHFMAMPDFTKEDIKIILKDMKKRHMDPDEPYKLYIVGDTSKTNFVLTVYKNKGFLIEHANEDKKCEFLNYCMIENKDICNILYEFAKEYVPTRLAMPDDEAMKYIDSLIEMAENN